MNEGGDFINIDFEMEYKKTADIVYRYLLKLCNNCDIAEELTQEIFYKAIKNVNKFKGECEFTTWLCQIAKYSWYYYYKKNKRKGIREISINEVEIFNDKENIEENYIKKESIALWYEKLNQLNEKEETIIRMRLGNFSFKK